MKRLFKKLTGSALAVLMVLSMMPASALADTQITDVGSDFDEKSYISGGVANSKDIESGDESTDMKTDVDVAWLFRNPNAFQVVRMSNNPVYVSNKNITSFLTNSPHLWVETVNGAEISAGDLGNGSTGDYKVTWKRIDKPNTKNIYDPLANTMADPTDEEWEGASVAGGSTVGSEGKYLTNVKDNPDYKNNYRFTYDISDDGNLEKDHVYFYRVEIKSGEEIIQPVVFKIVCCDKYWSGPISDSDINPLNDMWSMQGNLGGDYDLSEWTSAGIDGGIYKGSYLTWSELDSAENYSANYSTYSALAQKVSDKNTSKKNEDGTYNKSMLAGTWNVMMDCNSSDGSPLYTGTVMMRLDIDKYDPEATYSLVWKYGSDGVVEIPVNSFAEGGVSAEAGYAQEVNDDGNHNITFALKGTSSVLGAFGLVKTIKTAEAPEKYTITTEVVGGVGGRIIPEGTVEYTVNDGSPHTFYLENFYGYVVDSLTITKEGETTPAIVLHASDAGKSASTQGTWTGNQYTLPSNWRDNATLSVTFKEDTTTEDNISAAVKAGEHGSVYVGEKTDVNRVQSGKTVKFETSYGDSSDGKFTLVPGEPFTLYFEPDSGYGASQMTVKTSLPNGTSETETYLLDSMETKQVSALKGEATITVDFAEASPIDNKEKYSVRASVVGTGGTVSLNGSEGSQRAFTEVTEGSEATVYVTAQAGYTLKSAEKAVGEGIKDGIYTDILDQVSKGVSQSDGTILYTLKIAPVTGALDLRFTFEQGSIQPDTVSVTLQNTQAGTTTVSGKTVPTYNATLTRDDGTTGTITFYMLPPASNDFSRGTAQTFTFHVIGGDRNREFALNSLYVNNEPYTLEGNAGYVQLPMTSDVELLVGIRELPEGEKPSNPDTFRIVANSSERYEITPGIVDITAGATATFKVTAKEDTDNPCIQNVVETVKVDNHEVWPTPDTSYFSYDASGALIITSTGDKINFNPDTMILVIEGVAAPHALSADVMQAVGVDISYSADTGIIVPSGNVTLNGKIWWPLDENSEPTEMSVYAAAYDGYEISSFKVNNNENSEKVGTDELFESGSAKTQLGLWANRQDSLQAQSVQQIVRTVVLTPQASGDPVSYSTTYEYRLTKNDFYEIDWPNTNNVTITMATREVAQSYTDPETYPVTADVVGGSDGCGKVWVDQNGLNTPSTHLEFYVDDGSPLEIKLEADFGYGVSLLKDNDVIVPSTQQMKSYSIDKVDGPHNIEVTYGRVTSSDSSFERTVKTAAGLVATGDYNFPILLVLIAIACGSLGVALISHKRSRRRK